MKTAPETPSYDEAYSELQQIIADLQNDAVGIDDLAAKIERAQELVRLCREKLRKVDDQLKKMTDGPVA
ncbi:MAG: exodeoxyribonuclease VII small subunit [Saprospiraceae bacterium]|jgi:exodeoxyribonuclease VII small subunit|nr:exodeoxyribonuclease VII small subunit [Saprospiraceae bacterium]